MEAATEFYIENSKLNRVAGLQGFWNMCDFVHSHLPNPRPRLGPMKRVVFTFLWSYKWAVHVDEFFTVLYKVLPGSTLVTNQRTRVS